MSILENKTTKSDTMQKESEIALNLNELDAVAGGTQPRSILMKHY